jgi:formate hydrogenlyase subunit 3/multisubunit Na+/H+ antiporter MnhD subunit
MVASLLHPLNIFIIGLGGGFLIPLLNRLGKGWVSAALVLALVGMTLISGVSMFRLLNGAEAIEILTGGFTPPYSINLRLGFAESIFAFSVNLVALLGIPHFARAKYAVMLLYLILVMGIQGMVMTRDLFNLFVFLEIVSIATYGLLSLRDTPAALSATFKYLLATVVASTFFLLGTTLVYHATGMLYIDDLITRGDVSASMIGFAGLMFLLACLLIELKPFPANGWGLDVYETAASSVAALISVGVSAGVFFALLKLLPLFEQQLQIIAVSGALTFLFSNLIGLKQTKVQRLLGYSSIGQMGLLILALALLQQQNADTAIPLVIGGLFVNHLFAKAGLFWLAGVIGKEHLDDWRGIARRPVLLLVFGGFLAALVGLPPFPAFWAKWSLVMNLAIGERYIWIGVVLLGTLLEAVYLFRWFGRTVHASVGAGDAKPDFVGLLPVYGAAILLTISGFLAALVAGISSLWVFMPLGAGAALYLLDFLPGRLKCLLMLVAVLAGGLWLTADVSGLNYLFAVILLAGGLVVAAASLYRADQRRGFYPSMAVMLLCLPALPQATTSLEFFFIWELITISSYSLILLGRNAAPHALRYLLFSLTAAFFLLVGFAVAYAASGSISLAALRLAGPESNMAFVLLAIGFLIKAGAIGVHVWLPGAYAEADDDVSAMLSAVISKVAIFGLLVGTYLAIRSEITLELAHALGLIGMLTTVAGALMALRQDDMKRLLAYSSMSQLGYIVTAIALMSHLGWVTALYLVVNHMLVKGILFLAAAGVILRTGSRSIGQQGGLVRNMPFTCAAVVVAIIAMSGLPPLTGFGGKWLLLSAMLEKGWYWQVILGVVATFVGFLYMARFVYVIFFGHRRPVHDEVTEAPLPLLIPQYLMIAGIVIVSLFPKLLIEPVSAAIDPYFASTLVWEGMSLQMIYGYWNPVPTMAIAVAISVALFLGLWLFQRMRRNATVLANSGGKLPKEESVFAGFYSFYRPVLSGLTPPLARWFWRGLSMGTVALADGTRRIYDGNGQTYVLYIVYYFIALYVVSGGIDQIGIGR